MKIYGLIGKKLTHSFSPEYFRKKFEKARIEARYSIFELSEIADFQKLVKDNPDISGLNVTIPYKKEIVPFLTELDPLAYQIGSVNTIQFIRKEQNLILKGYNTDVFGFEQSLLQFLEGKTDVQALVLGTGGSASAVFYVLNKRKIPFLSVSRNSGAKNEISYREINKDIIQQHQLIINTTPVGMFPVIESAPAIPYQSIGKEHFLFDLIYNPIETEFLKRGKAEGAKTINGLKMLEIQAEEAWKIWNEDKKL
ncbi:MAG TPA: shikimate dehydrogenase [Bacteroidales bacterium]